MPFMGKLKALPKRTKAMLLVLVALVACFGIVQAQAHLLEKELLVAAQEKMDEMLQEADESAHDITVAKSYILFGAATGKIEMYVRPKGNGDENIHAVQLFFTRDADGWIYDGSGASADPASQSRALKAFGRSR